MCQEKKTSSLVDATYFHYSRFRYFLDIFLILSKLISSLETINGSFMNYLSHHPNTECPPPCHLPPPWLQALSSHLHALSTRSLSCKCVYIYCSIIIVATGISPFFFTFVYAINAKTIPCSFSGMIFYVIVLWFSDWMYLKVSPTPPKKCKNDTLSVLLLIIPQAFSQIAYYNKIKPISAKFSISSSILKTEFSS